MTRTINVFYLPDCLKRGHSRSACLRVFGRYQSEGARTGGYQKELTETKTQTL